MERCTAVGRSSEQLFCLGRPRRLECYHLKQPEITPQIHFWKDVSPFQIPQSFSRFQIWVTRQISSMVKKSFSSWLKIEFSAEHNLIQTHMDSQSHTIPSSNIPSADPSQGKSSKLSRTHPTWFCGMPCRWFVLYKWTDCRFPWKVLWILDMVPGQNSMKHCVLDNCWVSCMEVLGCMTCKHHCVTKHLVSN